MVHFSATNLRIRKTLSTQEEENNPPTSSTAYLGPTNPDEVQAASTGTTNSLM